MKGLKKYFAIFGVAVAMFAAIVPLAGWTGSAIKAEEISALTVQSQEEQVNPLHAQENGVMPLYGGSESYTFIFDKGRTISFTASAGNWIWPFTDEAVITVKANFDAAYYSFQVRFIWTNSPGRETTWSCPGQLDEITGYPFMLLSKDNDYTIKYTKNCTDATGNPGTSWSCAYIVVRVFAKDGNSGKVQSTEIGPVYF